MQAIGNKVRNVDQQIPTTTGAKKSKSPNMLRANAPQSQQSQPNMSSIERARKFRNGQKRSAHELNQEIFKELSSGETLSVSKISKRIRAAWSSTFFALSEIEYIQSMPRVVREGDMKRKRYYSLGGPRKR